MSIKTIETILDSGYVQRFHAQPHMPKQDLAQHQWRVAMLLHHFYTHVPPEAVYYALTHDCAELATGDIPSPVKRASESIRDAVSAVEDDFNAEHRTGDMNAIASHPVSSLWRSRVKLCDMIEGLRFCAECVMTGNQFAKDVGKKWLEYLDSYPAPQTEEMVMFIAKQNKILTGEK
ncbi:hypothetical protein [Vibrio phage vB_VpaM_VPs20]|uniref:Uncharacterized protein n=1 Tax=Vibrio phage vB_VpaM_VPs20 TaxID=2978980 RepID=A0A9X9NZS4_9CAUD|nr:hypothetical protein QNH06_gp08 [Vibrio phage vB_VpaM_VPs20]UYD72108.1 hypothetical protein [Vibrio phage vB_VpaM_VPs20]